MLERKPELPGWYKAAVVEPHSFLMRPDGRPVNTKRVVCLEVRDGVYGLSVPTFYGKRIEWGEMVDVRP